MKLYELADQYNQVAYLMEQTDDMELLQSTLDALNDQIEVKIENIIRLWRTKVGLRDTVKAESYRLEQLEKRYERDAKWLFEYVEREMKRIGMDNVPSTLFKIALQNNPPSVDIVDESLVPIEWIRRNEVISPDKKGMMEFIKNGGTIPGVELKQEKSLRVR